LGTPWQARLRRVDIAPGHRDYLTDIEVFRLVEG